MAVFAIRELYRLDPGYVLAPERYDPRRATNARVDQTIGDVAEIVAELVDSRRADPQRRYVVLDTGDAQEGLLRVRRGPTPPAEIGSAKKRLQPGDVIISRLRPYLRQVAYVDPGAYDTVADVETAPIDLVCSTEFYVLRGRNDLDLAFLVPWLLSDPVQEVLAASQEGGHHPRFSQSTLEGLGIPASLLQGRSEASAEVRNAVASARQSDLAFRRLIRACNVAAQAG